MPLAKKILADYDSLGDVVTTRPKAAASAFDRQSIAEYLDRHRRHRLDARTAGRRLRHRVRARLGEQSALNFLFLIGTGDLDDASACALLGESDERYKVRGGNQRIVDELAKRVAAADPALPSPRGDQEQGLRASR